MNIRLKHIRSLVHCGNRKIGTNTMIFNMCSATHCPNRIAGLCVVCEYCYALKAEKLYPEVLPYRIRQEKYWNNTDINTIIDDFCNFVSHKYIKVEYFRYNESGDFRSLEDIRKLHLLSSALYKNFGIITYGYSASVNIISEYLKSYLLPKNLIIKTSGYNIIGMPSTRVIGKNEIVPNGYKLCPMKNCMTKCKLCIKNINVAFRKH